jgi:hypothetical protein
LVLAVLDHLQLTVRAIKVQPLFLALLLLQAVAAADHITALLLLLADLVAAVHGKDHHLTMLAVLAQQGKDLLAVVLMTVQIFKLVQGVAVLVLSV